MAKVILNIDGYIGSFGYSKQWVTQMLQGHENDEIEVNVSSLGGSVDHALAIHDMFAKHGNVIINLTGFVASSATLISMGGREVRMSENAFFLVHKVLSWIDEFGLMNEDDIEALITRLTKEKNENAKITLQLAKIYAGRTKKSAQDILNLMKEDTWLTAEEALEWGFINSIEKIAGGQVNLLDDLGKVAMISANGLPLPTIRTRTTQTQNSIKPTMNSSFKHVNALLDIDGIEATADGVFLNLDQLGILNTKIENLSSENSGLLTEKDELTNSVNTLTQERDTQASKVEELTAQIETLTNEKTEAQNNASTAQASAETATNDLNSAIESLNSIDKTVSEATSIKDKVSAIRTILASKPGAKPVGTLTNEDDEFENREDEVAWDEIDKLPHNQGIE